ncbi:hypothetical protein ACFSQQ_37595 [Mesorhizobium kowhaii]|uniref:hypothetical protein n=1 Tax=Mesorhizobium kowhaii TaxID=1300272 RepID=UPI0035E9898A
MCVAFPLRSLLALMLGLLLAAALPAERSQGAAVFSDPLRITSIGGSVTEIIYALGEERPLVARDSTSYDPNASLKRHIVGNVQRLLAEGAPSVGRSGVLAVHGSRREDAIDAKWRTYFDQAARGRSQQRYPRMIYVVGKERPGNCPPPAAA